MKVFFIALLMIVQATMLKAQTTSLENTVGHLNNYFEKQPREKIYLHLDKPNYQPGERIWFKAYLTAGNFNQLSPVSKIIYVDLVNAQAESIFAVRLPANSGISYGDIPIPAELPSGNYRLRAYSNWMRNFNSGYFYMREIQIGNAPDKANGKPDEAAPSLSFYTDNSRNMVAGMENRVVFKIDRPAPGLHLRVLDGGGAVLNEFEPDQSGIGSFSVTPQAGSTYQAVLSSPDGEIVRSSLPEVVPSGLLIQSNVSRPDDIFIQLNASPSLANGQPLRIIIQRDGEVFYAARHQLDKEQSTFSLRKEFFPTGIATIGVFTDQMQLLAQKNLFIPQPESELALSVSSDTSVYNPREKVRVDISAGLGTDSLRVASLSVSVTHQDKVPFDTLGEPNILTGLYLESESAAPIASPGQFALSSAINDQLKLDQLALTLVRDDVWQFAKPGQAKALEFPAERDLTISGQVTRKNGDPVPFAKVLVLASEFGSVMDTVADENGRFIFDRLLFYGNTRFVVQARDEKGRRQVNITLDETGNHQISANEISGIGFSDDSQLVPDTNSLSFDALLQAGANVRSILLDNVKVRAEKKNPAANSSNLNGAGNADQIITADDLETCSDLTMCLQGRLLGVIFANGIPYSTRSPSRPMQVIVDGMYLDAQALSMIPVFDVASIEVLRRPSTLGIYGSMGAGGVIIVTTKRGGGDYDDDLYSPGIVTHSSQGLYEISTFQSPDYSQSGAADPQPDRRSTIYWNPNIITNEKGRASFEFYTADEPGTYRIIVEGIDIYGRIGRKEFFIENVNK